MWLTLFSLAAGLFAFYWLCCLSAASLRQREEELMNTILDKDWYWIWCHTTTPVGQVSYSTHERIDAVYASAPQAAAWLAHKRHGIKPNMKLEAVKCVDKYDKMMARDTFMRVNARNEQFEQFMTLTGNTAHKDRS